MKVGGNQSARDFFTRHGGAAIMNDSDTKKKYTHRVADMYKEELVRRVKEDVSRLIVLYPKVFLDSEFVFLDIQMESMLTAWRQTPLQMLRCRSKMMTTFSLLGTSLKRHQLLNQLLAQNLRLPPSRVSV